MKNKYGKVVSKKMHAVGKSFQKKGESLCHSGVAFYLFLGVPF